MTTRTRRPRRRLDLADYGGRVDAFLAQVNEATYRQLAGLDEEMGLEAIYAEHGALFEPAIIDGLIAASEGDAEAAAEARALLGFAVAGHVAAAVSTASVRAAAAAATWPATANPSRARAWSASSPSRSAAARRPSIVAGSNSAPCSAYIASRAIASSRPAR